MNNNLFKQIIIPDNFGYKTYQSGRPCFAGETAHFAFVKNINDKNKYELTLLHSDEIYNYKVEGGIPKDGIPRIKRKLC